MHVSFLATLVVLWAACAGMERAHSQEALSPGEEARTELASDIWTAGDILKSVNELQIYPDSKTYVDKPINTSQEEVVAAFESLPKSNGSNPTTADLQAFLNEYFEEPGSDLMNYTAMDFVPDPANFLPLLKNESIAKWGRDVHELWSVLTRKEIEDVSAEPERHSLLTLPYPLVVAGARFREVYYWDSYFIVRGLLVSGMKDTAKGVVMNLSHLLRNYGHVPNGARSYYINRSQPPLLSEMVKIVYEATQDKAFLESQLASLETEYKYWTQAPLQVTVIMNNIPYNLSRYWSTLYSPRPESFREDTETAEGLSPDDSAALWHNLATAAASGWDFSSRWFKDGKSLRTCQASQHLPADLNSFLFGMEMNLANFSTILGKDGSGYRKAAAARKEAFDALLWDQKTGQWRDLVIGEMDANTTSNYTMLQGTYASNWVPLWAGVAAPQSNMAVAASKSLAASGLVRQGGVMTSLYNTSQQWDAPNAWPPLQYFMVEGLRTFGDESAQTLSKQLAQAWLESNYAGYEQLGVMSEKYDATAVGGQGGGGEYDIQVGFGWTNGVALYFLQQYGWNPTLRIPEGISSASAISTP